jgi:hypothetical protein
MIRGERRVNKLTPDRPNLPDSLWLDKAIGGAIARTREPPASTFDPEVAGSNPARRSCPALRATCYATVRMNCQEFEKD